MANKTIVQLTSKPTLTPSDLIPVGDASTAILYKRTIADLLGAGNAVTSTTGTTNYLPKFTSANVLGNSQIFDNGTNVGIGINSLLSAGLTIAKGGSKFIDSPQYFQPSGNVVLSIVRTTTNENTWFGILGDYDTTSGSANLLLQANHRDIGSQAGHYVSSQAVGVGISNFVIGKLVTSTSLNTPATKVEQFRIVGSTGNVGIGTTNPSDRLTVSGSIRVQSGSSYILNRPDNGASSTILMNASNQLVFTSPSGATFTGNVGIGITNPAYRLDVAGDININGVFRINGTPINTGGGGAGTITGAGTTNYLPKWTSSSALGDSPISISGTNTNILVGSTGGNAFLTMTSIAPFGFSWGVIRANDGVGGAKTIVYDAADHNWYTAGAGKMYLSGAGDLYINQPTTSGTYKLDVGGAIRSTVDVIITSDKRVKENIINVTDALSKVDAMQGVYYTRKDIAQSKQYIGFLAQDIEGTLPQVVTKDSLGNYGVSYGNITALHNEAIKELNKEIKYLKSIINGSTN